MEHDTNYITTDHLFEIPWNGDPALLSALVPNRDKVSCIYLPCAIEHGVCTASDQSLDVNSVKEAVEMIQDAGFNPCVLMQRQFKLEYFSFYKDLGVTHFTVGEDKVAEYIRDKLGDDAYLVASVTKDLMNDDYQMYSEKQ